MGSLLENILLCREKAQLHQHDESTSLYILKTSYGSPQIGDFQLALLTRSPGLVLEKCAATPRTYRPLSGMV
jgi:hypothetical protein